MFNEGYSKRTTTGHNHGDPVYGSRRFYPSETDGITSEQLRLRPFFRDFRDEEIYGDGGNAFVRDNPYIGWYALSHGIPAESFAAGANPVPKWDGVEDDDGDSKASSKINSTVARNTDMAVDCNPKRDKDGNLIGVVNWVHSYFIQRPLHDTKKLYEMLTEIINGKPIGDKK